MVSCEIEDYVLASTEPTIFRADTEDNRFRTGVASSFVTAVSEIDIGAHLAAATERLPKLQVPCIKGVLQICTGISQRIDARRALGEGGGNDPPRFGQRTPWGGGIGSQNAL